MTQAATPTSAKENDMRIASLETSIREGIGEIKSMITALDDRLRGVEVKVAEIGGTLDMRIKTLELLVTELQKRVDELEKAQEQAAPWVKAVKWMIGLFAGLVLTLAFSILTHEVELVFH